MNSNTKSVVLDISDSQSPTEILENGGCIPIARTPTSFSRKRRREPILIDEQDPLQVICADGQQTIEIDEPPKKSRQKIPAISLGSSHLSDCSPQQLSRQIKVLLKSKRDQPLGFVKKLNFHFTAKELKTLLDCNSLCDEVINTYLSILCDEFPQTYFVSSYWSSQVSAKGGHAVEEWNATLFLKEVINLKDQTVNAIIIPVLIPINSTANHWVLCCLNPKQRLWSILDSAGNEENIYESHFFQEMGQWLLIFAHPGDNKEGGKWLFKFPINAHNRHQNFNKDSYNCGVYVCYYAREIATGVPLQKIASENITKSQISSFRCDVLQYLINKVPLSFD